MKDRLLLLLKKVAQGELTPEEAFEKISFLPFEDLGFAKIDHHRSIRKHFPEVIYGPGKTSEELEKIVSSFIGRNISLLITKISEKKALKLKKKFPILEYFPRGQLLGLRKNLKSPQGKIVIVSAGTADGAILEEARVCAEYMGNNVETIVDIGIAGVHRIFPYLETLRKAKVLIVIAGMEGALPSLISGMVECPIIAVPTSTGYGAHFQGLAPLLGMLNSCSPGVAVVNIDNGFGAAYIASLINHRCV